MAPRNPTDVPADLQLRRLRLRNLVEWIAARQTPDAVKVILRRWRGVAAETTAGEDSLWSRDRQLGHDLEQVGGLVPAGPDSPASLSTVEQWLRTGRNAPSWAICRDLFSGPGALPLVNPDPAQHAPGWCQVYATEVNMNLAATLQQALRQIAAKALPTSGASYVLQQPKGRLDHRFPEEYTNRTAVFEASRITTWLTTLKRFAVLPVFSWWRYLAGGLIDHLDVHERISLATALSLRSPERALLEAADPGTGCVLGPLAEGASTENSERRQAQLHAGYLLDEDLEMINVAMTATLVGEHDPQKIRLACQRQFERLVGTPPMAALVSCSLAYQTAIRLYQVGLLVDLRTIEQGTAAVAWAILRPVYNLLAKQIAAGGSGTYQWKVTPAKTSRELQSMNLHLSGDQIYQHVSKSLQNPNAIGAICERLRSAQRRHALPHGSDAISRATLCLAHANTKKGDWEATVSW